MKFFCLLSVAFLTYSLSFSQNQNADSVTTNNVNHQYLDSIAHSINTKSNKLLQNSHHDKKLSEEYNKSYDRLFTIDGLMYIVKVKSYDDGYVYFNYPLNFHKERMKRNKVSQIIYTDGKRDFFALPDTSIQDKDAFQRTEKDWEKVVILENEVDITDNYEFLEEVEVFYEANRLNANSKYLEKNVSIILRRKAASVGGNAVLIIDKKTSRPYADLPKINMKAKVYSLPE
ncbi:MAG: hypothetical protein MI922_17880 [Bacteroidales bacterium]|nr:hypothetical protein [Bacteroidales bacterium]